MANELLIIITYLMFPISVSVDGCLPYVTYSPEADMSVPEIIAYHGYPAESVTATTKDGYILRMHRIPFGKKVPKYRKVPRSVVFLQHGLLASSADWVSNLPNESAAFFFADSGFDVWMGNVRGNTYSREHVNMTTDDAEYWSFTWDEIMKYDLEAMINKVLQVTGQKDLYYIGHSQGTLIMLAKLATDQTFAAKIRKFFALAPVASVSHIKGLFRYIAKYMYHLPLLEKLLGAHEFLPNSYFIKLISRILCGISVTNPLCGNVLFLIAGPERSQLNQTRLMVYLSHTPAGTSTSNIYHWIQMVKSGKVQAFDYGSPQINEKHYNQTTPPLYDLSKVNVKTYLFWSESDWLADGTDIKESILNRISKQFLVQNNKLENFNHFDFVIGLRACDEIYRPILNIMVDRSNRTMNRPR